MLNILLFGPPGAGKGTQADILKEKYSMLHLSTGEAIRTMIAKGTELGLRAQSEMAGGKLASDELVCSIISEYIEQNSGATGVLFDGFPRTTHQAVALDNMLKAEGKSVTAMIAMEIPDNVVIDRITGRAAVSGRADDASIDTIKTRIETYKAQTAVVADHYRAQDKYFGLDGTGSIEEVNAKICEIIDQLLK
ncbi:MAG: adenylate kinase [Rikenellaceae bacterium]